MKMKLWLSCTCTIMIFTSLLCCRLLRAVYTSNADKNTLCFILDAGHGGEDGGAVSINGVKESTINLEITQKIGEILGLYGISYEMSRQSENLEYPQIADTVKKRKLFDLNRRVSLTDTTEKAVLVSIHQNKYPSASPSGAQVFYRTTKESEDFAVYTADQLNRVISDVRQSRPIEKTIYLMNHVSCPAILVECGFLSNPKEAELLQTEAYQTRLAIGLASACIGYSDELERFYGES